MQQISSRDCHSNVPFWSLRNPCFPPPSLPLFLSGNPSSLVPPQIPLHFALPTSLPFRSLFLLLGHRDFKTKTKNVELELNGQQQRTGEKEAIELRSRKSQTPIQQEKKTRATFENASATKISFHLRRSHSVVVVDDCPGISQVSHTLDGMRAS